MATYITKDFTYPIPDTWLSETFDNDNTGSWTYEGPEFLTFEIDRFSGKETGWCLWTDEDLERPVAEDIIRVTVDCKQQPLLCEIANDAGKPEEQEIRETREWNDFAVSPDGYENVQTIPDDQFTPRDIFDEFNITYDFDTEEFNIPVKNIDTHGVPSSFTWDDFRTVRNRMLEDADGVIDPHMPQEMQDRWLEYRRLLREAPTALAEFDPGLAIQMLPSAPNPSPKGDDFVADADSRNRD